MVYKSILFYFPSSYLWQTHVLLLKILFNSNVFPLQYNLKEKKKKNHFSHYRKDIEYVL